MYLNILMIICVSAHHRFRKSLLIKRISLISLSNQFYVFTITFPKTSPGPSKERLGAAYGTFVIGNKVYNAEKIVKPAYDQKSRILTIILNMKDTCYTNVTKIKRFSFSVQMNDCANLCGSGCDGCVCLDAATCLEN
jgi:hypothetical protein